MHASFRSRMGALAFSLAAALLGATSPAAGAQTLRIGGSSGAIGTLSLLVNEFRKSSPDAAAEVVPDLSSSGGIKAVTAGRIDLAVSSRALTDAEQTRVTQWPLGRTPFVFVTAKSNRTTSLSVAELEAFYAGARATWPDGSRVRMVLSPPDDKDNELLGSLSEGMKQAVAAAHARAGMLIEPTDHSQADAIERIPAALGTSTLALITSEARPLKAMTLNGVAPNAQTLREGRYPLVKNFYLITSRTPSQMVAKFVDFVKSAEGRAVLERVGFVPL